VSAPRDVLALLLPAIDAAVHGGFPEGVHLGVIVKKAEAVLAEPDDARTFEYEVLPSQEAVRAHIQSCEGRHVQQVAYSTFMDTLTQVCFTERRIRSTIEWDGAVSWTAK
jgi:hypothetical protein